MLASKIGAWEQRLILEEKTAIWELGQTAADVVSTSRMNTVFFEAVRGRRWGSRACLSRWDDHRVAILVHQGSDPTLPYQALVIRESAMLFRDFTSWGH